MTAQSGALPEIRLQGESVVFYLAIATGQGAARLKLRCDGDGNVWASVLPEDESPSANGDAHDQQ